MKQQGVVLVMMLTVASLQPCPRSPNCISTQATDAHAIAPLRYTSTQPEALARLLAVLRAIPRTTIVESGPDSIRVEFRTRILRFVDDAQFAFDDKSKTIHFRSASRVGYSDLESTGRGWKRSARRSTNRMRAVEPADTPVDHCPRLSSTSSSDRGSPSGSRCVKRCAPGTAARMSASISSRRSCPFWTVAFGRHQNVERDERSRARLSRSQRVKLDATGPVSRENSVDRRAIFLADGDVQQTVRRPFHQLHARPDDVRRNQERDDGVELLPARHGHRTDSDENTARRPDVRHQVAGVGFQCDGAELFCRAEQHAGHPEVHPRRNDRDDESEPHFLDRLRMQQAFDGRPADAHGGSHNERSFRSAGEVLRFGVAVGVVLVSGASGERQHRQGDDRRNEIDQRLERVGKQSNRTGQKPGGGLHGDRHDRRDDREPCVARQVRHGRQGRAGEAPATTRDIKRRSGSSP